jgi:hypothetical protein
MMGYLWHRKILLKNFTEYAKETTARLREASTKPVKPNPNGSVAKDCG